MGINGVERMEWVELDDFGSFGGCDYCIGELEAAIASAESGSELTGGWPPFRYGAPRPVPQEWRNALAQAIAIAEAEENGGTVHYGN
jgi:hypothetical protein